MLWRREVAKLFLLTAVALLATLPLLQVERALAQTIPPPSSGSRAEICGLGSNSRPYTVAITPQLPITANGPIDIPVTVRITSNLSQNVRATSVTGNLYRVTVGQGSYSRVSSATFSQQSSLTTDWKATLKDPATGSVSNFRYFIRVDIAYTASGLGTTGVHCHHPSTDFRIVAPGEPPTYNRAEIEKWFANSDIEGLTIVTSKSKDTPPSLTIPRSKLGNRPPENLVFKLVAHYGEGAFFIGNKDWLTFQGYLGDEKIDNLYFLAADGPLHANFVYSTAYETLRKGHWEEADEVGRAKAQEGDAYEQSLATYFTYAMNLPINADGTAGGDNCGTGFVSEGKNIAVTGPKNQGLEPEPDIETTTEKGVNGEDARELSQNCVNNKPNGWLNYWGVKDVASSAPGEGSGCTIAWVLSGIGSGPDDTQFASQVRGSSISAIFNRITICLFYGIVYPALTWAAGLVEKAAGVSFAYPLRLAGPVKQTDCYV